VSSRAPRTTAGRCCISAAATPRWHEEHLIAAPLQPSHLGDELLDDPAADPAVVEGSLRHIARANVFFGGRWALHDALQRTIGHLPVGTRLTLLDLGTGDGAMPRAAAAWGARRGLTIVPLGLERSPTAARLATAAQVPTMLADAGALPVRDASVDLVLMNLMVHHFAPESVVRLMQDADRVARRAVIISDLQRSTLARLCFVVGSRLLGFDRVTRQDGDTSIQRGFTVAELAGLTRRAGLRATVIGRPFWRVVALWHPQRGA